MSVHAKLLNAQQSVEAVVKRGVNTQQNYKYVQASDVIEVARKALHEQGLSASVADVFSIERERFVLKKGTEGLYVHLNVALRVSDPESGTHAEFIAAGGGADYGGGDKAILKAQTAATKYAYANALALPFADFDPEKDSMQEPGRLPEQKADPDTALPDERVAEIAKAYKASGFDFDRLCVAIGGVGGDSPKINRKDSIRKAVATLSSEQADKLENLLDAAAKGAAK